MEYQALYRKYRPTKFSDVVDQESILKIITNSIKEGKISHAYLFSGPRGTGKTTIAKLLAKTVNCLNLNKDLSICGQCENCIDILNNSSDIIEIDAASNNGVEEIRELKSKINLVPAKLKYKVYIIDEVHMLSISAFNALLKTLEEPPRHVIFILATTEFYKVPTTIVSRCQCLNFKRISKEGLSKRIRKIADLEKIKITDEAINEITTYADGGMRDALGMLDKLASYSLDLITEDDFLRINGLISQNDLNNFIELILEKKNKEVIETLDKFEDLGLDYLKLVEKILERLRDLIVEHYTEANSNAFNTKDLYDLIFNFNDIYNLLKEATNRKIIVEVKLLEFMNKEDFNNKQVNQNNQLISESLSKNSEVRKINQSEKNISQEISKNDKNVILNQKQEGNRIEKEEINYRINDKIKRQRIDNTFAMASKNLKNYAISKLENLNDYIVDSTYGEVAGLLKDTKVGVVSARNIIFVTKYPTIIKKLYTKFSLTLKLLKKIFENDYQIVFLTEAEFQEEVKSYKEHLTDKNYYTYQEEKEDFIIFNEEVYKDKNLCYGNLVQKAIEVFGTDCVEIE